MPLLLRFTRSLALLAGVCAPLAACAQQQQGPPEKLDIYGPYAAKLLLGGRGLEYAINPEETLLDATQPWTMSLWFHPAAASPPAMTALLAGWGDPAAEDSRYLGLKDGRPVLRLGLGNEVDATTAVAGAGWHLLAATFDGVTAHLYLDGAEVASGTPMMGNVMDAELMVGPDFMSDQDARYKWDQPHLPAVVPPQLRVWQHYGGKIAGFSITHDAATADQVKTMAAERPDFDTLVYDDGSKPWPFQVVQEVGYVAPQPPDTLPHDKAPFGTPKAKPLPPGGPTLEQTGEGEWTLARNWRMQAAPKVIQDGAQLSGSDSRAGDANSGSWYQATMPGTVLTTLVDRGVYPDPDWDMNNLDIPESLSRQNYWYRVAFPTPGHMDEHHRYTLDLNGINYTAHVWLNGRQLGTIEGAFLRGMYDVTALLRHSGQNVLAVQVDPAPFPGIPWEESIKGGPGWNGGSMVLDGPTFMATEGWDWIPSVRDRDTGIWQDVTLKETGEVALGDPQIITTLPLPRRDAADVVIHVPLENPGTEPEKTTLHASFDGGVSVTRDVTVPPGGLTVSLTPKEYPQLHVEHPRLWWPNGYGKPELYHLELALGDGGDHKTVQFGMREVTYELSLFAPDGTLRRVDVNPTLAAGLGQKVVDVSHLGTRETPNGWAASLTAQGVDSPAVTPVTNEPEMRDLVIVVNGVRIAARGGNWGMDDMMKRINRARLEPYFRLHQLANVNIIRNWQGQNTEPVFYDLADRYGLMVWNDFWEVTEDSNAEAEDPALFLRNATDVVERYRNHPSIVIWCGRNEGVPQPAITEPMAAMLAKLDGTRYFSPSSNRVNLRNSGPYRYQDPALYFSTLNRGFSVELGIPSLSTLESFRYWIAPANQWPVSDAWAYHDWHENGNGDVHPFMQHLDMQFGAPTSLPDMERKAQMLNYTLHRAIFEGFNAHLWEPNSGRMIWMTQPAWPSNMWQMFSHDYDTQASFYGVMHASEPRHVQLDLSDYSVDVTNTTLAPLDNASVVATVYSLDNRQLYTKTESISVPMDQMAHAFTVPMQALFAGPALDSPVFVRLKLQGADGTAISSGIYWLAEQEADLRQLNSLPQADIATHLSQAADGAEQVVTAQLTNRGSRAAVELKLTLENQQGGARILPAYYSDNYITLLPGESETVTIRYPATAATGPAALGLRGYNLAQTVSPIGR